MPLLAGLLAGCGAGSWEGGIHARLGWSEENGLRIVEVPDGPGKRAGLEVSDRIVTIDGQSVSGLDVAAVRAMLRGPVGSTVELEVVRGGGQLEEDREQLTVERAPYR